MAAQPQGQASDVYPITAEAADVARHLVEESATPEVRDRRLQLGGLDPSVMGLWLVFVGVYGAGVGSYLGVVVDRLPAGRGMAGGSRCGACGQALRRRDNVPVLAFLWLGGRCRSCRTPIPPLWWLLEVTTAAAWVGCAAALGTQLALVVALLGVWVVVLEVGLRVIHRRSAGSLPSLPALVEGPRWWEWFAAAVPVAAVSAQVVALGAAIEGRPGTFLLLGGLGMVGLIVAVLVAPRDRAGRAAVVPGR